MAKKRGNNEGTIYQRSYGKWRAQISLDGRRVCKSFDSRKQAQIWLREMATQIDRGLTYQSANVKLEEYLQEWLDSKKSKLSEHTWHTYSQLIRDYIEPALGPIRLRDLTATHIQRFYNQCIMDGIGARTVEKTHTVIHAALNSAMKMGVIRSNPDASTDPPKPVKQEMKFLNQNQVRVLLSFAEDKSDRLYALYYLAIVTGMRQGELLGLRWDNVDIDRGILQVKHNLKRTPGGGLELKQPKTKSSIRSIKLGKDSIDVLREHKRSQDEERSTLNRLWIESNHVFVSPIGSPIDPSNLLRKFRQLLKEAGLPKVRFHDLRHTAASIMLNNGIDVLVASQRLGHAKPSITLDVYGHLMPAIQNEAAEVLDNILSG